MTGSGATEAAGASAWIISRRSVLLLNRVESGPHLLARCSEDPSDDLVSIRIKAAAVTEHDPPRSP